VIGHECTKPRLASIWEEICDDQDPHYVRVIPANPVKR
jgi:hypothetical protein